MRLYIAGPMTGIPQFNYPAFIEAAEYLRALGHEVISPAELDDPDDKAAALASTDGHMLTYTHGTGKTWGDFLARDVKLISDAGLDGIAVLPGWEKSRGSRLETFVGHALNALPLFSVVVGQGLAHVPDITAFRAWCAEPDLAIAAAYSLAREVEREFA